ncbi:acetyltransferase [Pseudomonas amygdali pv. mori str. 301020]|uniref:Acetyltransferase n=1 Tax=Pseudomonas amygdali pv. mori str. 301020 TaxID=629261 RepID=A0A656GBQ0_PSEA0|nr:acetyltransferase [Pseudomonas amygdali pv. mori str. 301020]
MTLVDIRKVIELPPQLLILEKEAVAQGFRFVTRLIDDWESGNNRFDAQGECLMGAFLNEIWWASEVFRVICVLRATPAGCEGGTSQAHIEVRVLAESWWSAWCRRRLDTSVSCACLPTLQVALHFTRAVASSEWTRMTLRT